MTGCTLAHIWSRARHICVQGAHVGVGLILGLLYLQLPLYVQRQCHIVPRRDSKCRYRTPQHERDDPGPRGHPLLCALVPGPSESHSNGAPSMLGCVAVQWILRAAAVLQVLTFPEEKLIVFKEHRNNWYSLGAYFAARMMAELPFQMWVVVAAAKPASLPPTCACVRRILPLMFCLEVYWYACAWPWRRAGRRMTGCARRIPGLGTGRQATNPCRS